MAYSPPVGPAVAELITEELRAHAPRGQHVGVVFEEIKDLLTGEVVGYEVLTRPAGNVPPVLWYQQGRALGLMAELEARAIELALGVLPRGDAMITVNFSLDVLDTRPVQRVLRELSKLDRPAVVELSEHHHTSGQRLLDTLSWLRDQGLRIAVDDAGTGDSDPAFVRAVAPDIIKIDHTNTWALNYSARQREFVKGYLDIARELNAQVVVEGVSSELVAKAVRGLGAQYDMNLLAQGYWVTRTNAVDVRDGAQIIAS